MKGLTPHNDAPFGAFGNTVLMPGDPLRAKFIAETFLENPELVNNVRGVQGYTGTYHGVRVSVMASGMGMPSIGIYAHELFNFYGVQHIIRVGSAGSIQENVRIRDLVIAQGACTDSAWANQYHLPGTFAPIASYRVLSACMEQAEALGFREKCHVGNLVSSDCYYCDNEGMPEMFTSITPWKKMGVMAIDMEAAGLYMIAARSGKDALAICTVSNNILTGEETDPEERQLQFTQMIRLALETAVALEK